MIGKVISKNLLYLTCKVLNNPMCKYSLNYLNIRITKIRFFYRSSFEGENVHNILLSHPSYFDTTINSQKLIKIQHQFINNSVQNYSFDLSESSSNKYVFEADTYLQDLKKIINNNISKFSDDELIKALLTLITLSPIKINRNSKLLFNILSEECIKRSQKWTIDQILLFADIWYNISIGLPIYFKYFNFAVKRLHKIIYSMDAYQFTQSFFYLSLCSKYEFGIQQNIIEKKIEYALDYIGIEELAIISLGIFSSRNYVYDIGILKKIVKMIIDNKENISDFSLVALLKFLKKNLSGLHVDHIQLCSTVLSELQTEVKRLNNFSLMQLVSLGNDMNLYNEKLLNNIFDHFAQNIQSARLKEMERFAYVLTNVKRKLKNSTRILKLIESELMSPRREREIYHFYDSLLSCVYYITCMEHYNHHLISIALELNEFGCTNEDLNRFRHLFELDQMVKIEESKNYRGHRLSKDFLNRISRKCIMRFPSWTNSEISTREKQFLEVNDVLLKVLKEEFTKIAFTLPFSTMPNILFCTDKLGNIIKFPHAEFNYSPEDVKYKPQSELIWHALVILNVTSYNRNSNTTKGVVDRNIRLIRKLGYNVIIVDKRLMDKEYPQDPTEYLLKLLETCVNKDWLSKLKINCQRS